MLSTDTHVFSEIFIHLNWHCKGDFPYLRGPLERDLHKYLEDYCLKSKGVKFHGVNGTEDHVHLVIQIEPAVCIADWAGKIKGASAYEMNKRATRVALLWQRGYGAVSFARRDLPAVLKYVARQKEHHRQGSANETLENHGLMIEGKGEGEREGLSAGETGGREKNG